MSDYVTEVQATKSYIGNVVILIDGQYYGIREPDSGLTIGSPFNRSVESLVINPTTIDLRRVTTTISSYSFKLTDIENSITTLIAGRASAFIGKDVTIYLGRSGVNMAFADYYQLPIVKVKKVSHPGNAYTFSATEDTDRMQRPIYDFDAKLGVDILAATTTITLDRDLTDLPTSGLVKINSEFLSYTGVNLGLNQITGCVRGELNTTPADHDSGSDVYQAQEVEENPVNILLQILTSGGGGSAYDVLSDGLAIDQTLIDITEIEAIRDELFSDYTFNLVPYNIDNALKYIEKEILAPLNVRFTYSSDGKLSLAVLDQAVFVEETGSIDEDSISKTPTWEVDGSNVTNNLKIEWDYDESVGRYLRSEVFTDATSITDHGISQQLSLQFKGVKDLFDGEDIVTEYATRLLIRLSQPTPIVGLNTHIDKSLQNIGDKSFVESTQIPNVDGTLTFASEMEIVSRSINFITGDVSLKLAFTSFTDIRSGYIAPSDLVDAVVSQSIITVPAGRGTYYKAGWVMRLWNENTAAYAADPVNTILSISGDNITFEDAWSTVLTSPDDFRIRFADYDDCADTQKRYAFVSDDSNNFPDGGTPYSVTY